MYTIKQSPCIGIQKKAVKRTKPVSLKADSLKIHKCLKRVRLSHHPTLQPRLGSRVSWQKSWEHSCGLLAPAGKLWRRRGDAPHIPATWLNLPPNMHYSIIALKTAEILEAQITSIAFSFHIKQTKQRGSWGLEQCCMITQNINRPHPVPAPVSSPMMPLSQNLLAPFPPLLSTLHQSNGIYHHFEVQPLHPSTYLSLKEGSPAFKQREIYQW